MAQKIFNAMDNKVSYMKVRELLKLKCEYHMTENLLIEYTHVWVNEQSFTTSEKGCLYVGYAVMDDSCPRRKVRVALTKKQKQELRKRRKEEGRLVYIGRRALQKVRKWGFKARGFGSNVDVYLEGDPIPHLIGSEYILNMGSKEELIKACHSYSAWRAMNKF